MNNKNLAKKGTIIVLALAVVIGMSYFSSQDYLNMSIMDMLLGATTYKCQDPSGDCGHDNVCNVKKDNPSDCGGCRTYNGSGEVTGSGYVQDTWPTEDTTVTYTYKDCTSDPNCDDPLHDGRTISDETSEIRKPTGQHERVMPSEYPSGNYTTIFKNEYHIQSWDTSKYQVHHVIPQFMGGQNNKDNLQLVEKEDHRTISSHCTSGSPSLTSYCKGTNYNIE